MSEIINKINNEIFWIRNKNDIYENALNLLPVKDANYSANLNWSNLEFIRLDNAGILIEPASGSWIGISPSCASLEEAKSIINESFEKSPELKSFLFRRNIVTDETGAVFYPPTIETPEGRNLPLHYLFVVETTERCNLRCVYCFKSASTKALDMTEEMAYKVADYISAFGDNPISVDFSGGEPTLNLKIIEIIASELSKRTSYIDFSIQTNATLISNELIELVKRYKIHLSSSLEGSIEDLKTLRPFANGKDAGKQILNGISKLSKERLISGVVSSYNSNIVNNYRAFYDMIEQIGISTVKLNLCSPLGRWETHKEEMEAELIKYTEYVKQFVAEGMKRPTPIKESITNSIADKILNRIPQYRCINSPCDAGYTFQNIRPNGDIYPCDRYSRFSELKLGNINSILADEEYIELRNNNKVLDFVSSLVLNNKTTYMLNKRTVHSINTCSKCNLRSYCGSGCGMESYCVHNSFDKPSAECKFFKEHIPQVFEWLINSSRFRDIYYPNNSERFSYSFSYCR
ncbi:MAG TPA: radical SAM protein [Ignavibacteria bacterium]